MNKVILVGVKSKGALENSYASALENLRFDVTFFEYKKILSKYIKLGKLGKIFHNFLPIYAWQKKMNRELIVLTKEVQPNYIVYFTNAPINAGTILCVKTMYPSIKHILIWPDTPFNLDGFILQNAALYDFTATYSFESIRVFQYANFKNVHWIPLAADETMFNLKLISQNQFKNDVGFVGGWRPEREAALLNIIKNFPNLRFAIYGPYWKRECKNKLIIPFIAGNGLYESDLASFFNSTKLNINIIDDTNFPSANMRFFEIPVSGGLQLSSFCPEFSDIFIDKKHILYYQNLNDLVDKVKWYFENEEDGNKIRLEGFNLVKKNHLYKHRVQEIFNKIK